MTYYDEWGYNGMCLHCHFTEIHSCTLACAIFYQYTYGPFVHSITTTYNIEEKNDIARISK